MREEIEEALLSKLMNKKNLYYSFYNTLTVDLFSNDIYKEVFISIDLLYQQG